MLYIAGLRQSLNNTTAVAMRGQSRLLSSYGVQDKLGPSLGQSLNTLLDYVVACSSSSTTSSSAAAAQQPHANRKLRKLRNCPGETRAKREGKNRVSGTERHTDTPKRQTAKEADSERDRHLKEAEMPLDGEQRKSRCSC